MNRGPPIDSEIIFVDDNGRIKRISIDVMFHTEGLPEGIKEKVLKELEDIMGKSGRKSDYLVGNPFAILDLRAKLQAGKITQEEYNEQEKAILEASPRVFPFKTLNSYLEDHTLADDYIFAVKTAIYNALNEVLLKVDKETGKYADLKDGWENEVIMKASQAANGALLNIDDFYQETKGEKKEGKYPLQMMLEAHVVDEEEKDLEKRREDPEGQARLFLEKGDAMRAVRDAALVAEDGRILSYLEEGIEREGEEEITVFTTRLGARVRHYSDIEKSKYTEAYNKQKKATLNQATSVERKNAALLVDKEKKQAEMEARGARENVDGLYATSRGVLSNVKDVTTPVVVFLPCSMFDQSQKKGVSSKVRRELGQKYDTKNLQIVFYDSKEELLDGKNRMKKILDQPGAAAIVFCDAEAGIHPKGDTGKDLFPRQTAYYVNEQIDKSAAVTAPLVGTHVAFALGLRDWMAGNRSPELRDGLNALITQITGSDANIMERLGQVDGVEKLLEQMLKGGFILPIRKIDFETLREQIEAEEAALKSL